MDISLNGRRAFITAGGAGMGRATALAMLEAGATVFTCDIDESAMADLPAEISRWRCDVSSPADLDAIFDEILPGGLDIMVNNAGIAGPAKYIEDITDDEWRHTLAVCLDSQFYCARRVAPVFKAQRSGVIINLISSAGILGYPTRSPYAAAKWASTGLTKTWAMELGPDNIRVNGIVPGNVNGARMDRVVAAHATTTGQAEDEVRRQYALGVSMQCFVDPEEIADLIVFLCSDSGRHISGQVIGVDGHTETLWPRR
ncbi:MAG: SDR family oxidoreductase [Acidimicrobiia bacterium]|nr:SDR family oxidoreductase [Acidimicrobiia bacterium]